MSDVIPIPESEWFRTASLALEPIRDEDGRRPDRPNWRLVQNLSAMLGEPDRWMREIPQQWVFRHDTGILIQLKFHEADHQFVPNRLSKIIAVWMDGLPPFRIEIEREIVAQFMHEILNREAKPTIEKIGVIAALTADHRNA